MNRLDIMRKHINKYAKGLEIAPWHSPIVPKKDGYNSIVLDLFDTKTLKKSFQNGQSLSEQQIANIEGVDIVGNAVDIGTIVDHDTLQYIVSSHNFEHIPNPIKFLQGCYNVLQDDGMLSMAIPDKRGMFDYFRPLSTAGEMIEAFFENRTMPTLCQQYEHHAYSCRHGDSIVFMQTTPKIDLEPVKTVKESFEMFSTGIYNSDYADVHCWVQTPTSFQLNMLELLYTGLIRFKIDEIVETGGAEFFVHLRKCDKIDEKEFYEHRKKLLAS